MSRFHERMMASTRGRVLALLRREPMTVNELADALGLTDNAVRLHLGGLERDGLVRQEGVRPSGGKPASLYGLTPDADAIFPKAYQLVLSETLALVREWDGTEGLKEFLRAVGARAGDRAASRDSSLRGRVEVAVAVLRELGGDAFLEDSGDAFLIRGSSCPLSGVVAEHPETCELAEELVTRVAGAPATECCDRAGSTPRCRFRIPHS